jgi:hypothetical protein
VFDQQFRLHMGKFTTPVKAIGEMFIGVKVSVTGKRVIFSHFDRSSEWQYLSGWKYVSQVFGSKMMFFSRFNRIF